MSFTISQPTTWTNLSNKPTDFTDDVVDWNEVRNKPTTFNPTIETFNNSSSPGTAINTLLGGAGNSTGGYIYRNFPGSHYCIFLDTNDANDSFFVVSNVSNTLGSDPTILALRLWRNGDLKINGRFIATLPSSPTGLASGSFYKDSNGFVKVV